MTTATKRPVYLNLVQIKLPIAGFMSILHRASGALLFLAIPFFLYLLELGTSGEAGFAEARSLLHNWFFMLVLFGLTWSIVHHLLAGIRYLLLDIDVGVEKPMFRHTAWVVTIAAPMLALIIVGVLL